MPHNPLKRRRSSKESGPSDEPATIRRASKRLASRLLNKFTSGGSIQGVEPLPDTAQPTLDSASTVQIRGQDTKAPIEIRLSVSSAEAVVNPGSQRTTTFGYPPRPGSFYASSVVATSVRDFHELTPEIGSQMQDHEILQDAVNEDRSNAFSPVNIVAWVFELNARHGPSFGIGRRATAPASSPLRHKSRIYLPETTFC